MDDDAAEEENIVARCFDCKMAWPMSAKVVNAAYEMVLNELPEGAMVAFAHDLTFLCADCQAKRLAAREGARRRRAVKKRTH